MSRQPSHRLTKGKGVHRHWRRAAISAMALFLGTSTGCSATPGESACVGDWSIADMHVGEETVGEEQLAALDSMGLEIRLSVLQGGDAELIFLGDVEQGTWIGRPNGCVLTLSGEDLPVNVTDGRLTMTQGDQTVSFVPAGSSS